MAPRRTAIIRWTGRGELSNLESSVRFILRARGVRARVWRSGNSVMVEGPEPVGVAALFGNMPGVGWVASGLAVGSLRELVATSGLLAGRYLERGDRFGVEAEGSGEVVASDVAGAVTSGILEKVKGARASQDSPRVRFRAAFDGSAGAVGVETRKGPGGVPTGGDMIVCLVSGGKHSSVLSWMTLLAGYRLRLVHAKISDRSLIEVARLYSELSHRADPRGLRLEVVEGGSPLEALGGLVSQSRDPVFGGFYSLGAEVPSQLAGAVLAPLYVMPEEKFDYEFESLSLKGDPSKTNWGAGEGGNIKVRTFGGATANVSAVLDGLG